MVIDIMHSPWNLPPLLSWKGLRKRRWRLGRGLGANDVEAKGTKGKILSQKSKLNDVCVCASRCYATMELFVEAQLVPPRGWHVIRLI